MSRLFASEQALIKSGYLFRITDNGGATYDRYTIAFCDGDAILAHSGGVCTWTEGPDPQHETEAVENGASVDLAFPDLPPALRVAVLRSINVAWEDFLAMVEKHDSGAVAISREKAEVNDGTKDSAGAGIYSVGGGWAIRTDSDLAREDRGPYLDAADALRATLPEDYALSGPEYHSTESMDRTEPDVRVMARVSELESRLANAA